MVTLAAAGFVMALSQLLGRLDEVGVAAHLGARLRRRRSCPPLVVGLWILSSTSRATAGSRRISAAGRTTSASTAGLRRSASPSRRSRSLLGLLFGLIVRHDRAARRAGRRSSRSREPRGGRNAGRRPCRGPRRAGASPSSWTTRDRPAETARPETARVIDAAATTPSPAGEDLRGIGATFGERASLPPGIVHEAARDSIHWTTMLATAPTVHLGERAARRLLADYERSPGSSIRRNHGQGTPRACSRRSAGAAVGQRPHGRPPHARPRTACVTPSAGRPAARRRRSAARTGRRLLRRDSRR